MKQCVSVDRHHRHLVDLLHVVQNSVSLSHDKPMGVASNRQEEAIASSWILQNKNDQADQLFSLHTTKRRYAGT